MVKLFVIPGHGAGDSGATGNGYTEAERVRALATKIKQYGGDNVMLADFNRNYYADGGINSLNISKDYKIVELHMDAASASAKGGHVIIQAGIGGADEWDRALASLMVKYFPGRASTIVERSDLANPARAAARGYNYRLVENGFITNKGDVDTFNKNIDAIAKGYLRAFGIPDTKPDDWKLQMWAPNGTNNQRFKIEWDKKGEWFTLKCLADGRCIDVKDASKDRGAKIWAYTPNGTDAQWWKAEPISDVYKPVYNTPVYLIPKCAPNLVLDVAGVNDSNGASLQTWTRNGNHNQQWNMLDYGDGTVTLVTNLGAHRAIDVSNGGK